MEVAALLCDGDQHPSLHSSSSPTVQTACNPKRSEDIRTVKSSSCIVAGSTRSALIAPAVPSQNYNSSTTAVGAPQSDRSRQRPSPASRSPIRSDFVSLHSAGRYILPRPLSEPSVVPSASVPTASSATLSSGQIEPEWKIRCYVYISPNKMPQTEQWEDRRQCSGESAFARAVWLWKDVPVSLWSKERKDRLARSTSLRPRPNLRITLCFPLRLLENSIRDLCCYDQLTRMILGKSLFGLPCQCLHLQLRKRWFDKRAFDRIESVLVAHMLSEALKNYNAHVEKIPRGSVAESAV